MQIAETDPLELRARSVMLDGSVLVGVAEGVFLLARVTHIDDLCLVALTGTYAPRYHGEEQIRIQSGLLLLLSADRTGRHADEQAQDKRYDKSENGVPHVRDAVQVKVRAVAGASESTTGT